MPVRTSHCSRARSVKRCAISVSRWRSRSEDRATTVTCTPNEAKTCAISAAMKPPPMIASRSGSASMRMTVSEVWNGTPDSVTTSGTTGWAPAATTTWSAVSVSSRAVAEVDRERAVTGEARMPEVRRGVGPVGAVAPATVGDGVDAPEDAVAHVGPAHALSVASTP